MSENSNSLRPASAGKRNLRLLLLVAAVAILGSLLFASAAQATIRVQNTNVTYTQYNGLAGLRAVVDTAYFQATGTPEMRLQMNNSWGTNRYLEWRLVFLADAGHPHNRHLSLCLTVKRTGQTNQST